MYPDTAEDLVWHKAPAKDLWVLDKLILSRVMGYTCGPTGQDVPEPGDYVVRPCVNMLGLGLGTSKMYLERDTCMLPLGYFWCEFFTGDHYSVDYYVGEQQLCVRGRKPANTFTFWQDWTRVNHDIPLPDELKDLSTRHRWINCEFIGDKLIEVHLRRNEDFDGGISHFIPVWSGQSTKPPNGYTYRDYPDMHGRIGAFVR